MDHERRPLEQACSHAVGAAVLFAPYGPQHQSGAERGVTKAQIAVVVEQDAVAVGENDGIAGAGELVIQVRHFGVRERDQLQIAFLAGEPFLAR